MTYDANSEGDLKSWMGDDADKDSFNFPSGTGNY